MASVRSAPETVAPEISAPAEPSAEQRRRDGLVIWVLLVSTFTVILNETVMGVAIPRLMTDLDIPAVSAQWLTTAFLLTMAVVIPITGYLLQRFTTRAVYITAMVLFSSGTLLAALSVGFKMLLMARVVQASGTAIMIPLLMTTVMTLVPAAERGRRMGNITIVIALAPALGPTISGTILNFAGWRFLFWFVLPVALAALVFGATRITNVGERTAGALDIWSVPLAALGFGGIVFGLSKFGEDAATRDPRVIGIALGVCVLALGAFIWRQLVMQRTDRALLDLRTFRSRVFTVSIILFVIAMTALFGAIILLPLFAQGVLGMSVLQTGLLLLPGGLMFGLMGPVVGRWYDRVGPRPLVVPGAALIAISLWALVPFLSESTPWGALLAFHIVLSAGLSLLFTSLFSASLGSLPPHLYSHGSATLATTQQVAGAAGTAALVSTMSAVALSRVAGGASNAAGLAAGVQVAFIVAAGLATVGVGLTWLLPRQAPAADSGLAGAH
jgi:DHA2 family lincomycin resistance protein-like MFS transporter